MRIFFFGLEPKVFTRIYLGNAGFVSDFPGAEKLSSYSSSSFHYVNSGLLSFLSFLDDSFKY